MKQLFARAAFLAALFACGPVLAQNIAVVNGKPIPKAKADELVAELVKSGKPDSPELQQAVRERLITGEILMQEADKDGLITNPEVKLQLEQARQQVLIGALAQEYFKAHPPTDEQMHAQYDEIVKTLPTKEYHAHHILVDTEPAAVAIIAKLKAGGNFEELAKAQSKDPGSASSGGDLGWNSPATFDKTFADAMVKLPKGKFSPTPVKTSFGYHVIRLDDVRDAKLPTFDEAKPQIAQLMMQDQKWQEEEFRAMLAELRAKAKVE
jgi:peptidyl-prolyl cis-trans isomerase C